MAQTDQSTLDLRRLRAWVTHGRQRIIRSLRPGTTALTLCRPLRPVSRAFGYDRGLGIDRYYIEQFLSAHREDIHGDVLEVGDGMYTRRYGGSRVTVGEILHVDAGNPRATIIGDLTQTATLPQGRFDCVILTQTLQHIYEVRRAVGGLQILLRPGGIALVTLPGISQISRYDMDRWGDYWRFTTLSARRLFEEHFPAHHVSVQAYGNVVAATAFLQGLAADELRRDELEYQDPNYQVLITIRAVKPGPEA